MAFLTLIRHGQSVYNLQNRFTGNLDVPLTPFGEEEARVAGRKYPNPIRFQKPYRILL